MMNPTLASLQAQDPVPERLLAAALQTFLQDDYHRVSIRQIAQQAQVNVSMISYYFGNKQGLYESMIEANLQPLLRALDDRATLASPQGFADFFNLYYQTMRDKPDFARLILKVLALKQGPGRRFIHQLLERGRSQGAAKVSALKSAGRVAPDLDPDVVRMAFVSLAMMPLLIKDIFEEQGRALDADFLAKLAAFNGHLFAKGLSPHDIPKE